MNKLEKSLYVLAQSAEGNPVITTATVILFWMMFTVVEASIEKMIWGERFEHWLDPIFAAAFIGYAAGSVWFCAAYNSTKTK